MNLHKRALLILDRLDAAERPQEMDVAGLQFHRLRGTQRYTVHVNGPWCITFAFDAADVFDIDIENYH